MSGAPDGTLARAERFVAEHGDARARLQLAGLRGEDAARAALLEALAERGGGEGACERLGVLQDLDRLGDPAAREAAEAAAAAQSADGAWHPRATTAGAEPADPLYLTGTLAGLLARTPAAPPRPLARATRWLGDRFAPERLRDDGRAITAFACFFSASDHELADEALQWCGRELERAWRARRLGAARAARVFTRCDARALPGARVDADELRVALVSEQLADGSFAWPDDDSPPARVAATLDAITALRRFA